MCVCGGRVWPLPGQFVILRGNAVNDARTRDLPIWAYLTFCSLSIPLLESVIVICFVVRCFVSVLVLQSS